MRTQLPAVILPLLVLIAVGETQTPGPATLQKVDVIPNADSVRVEISGRGSWSPKVMALEAPSRIVVALPDTVMSTAYSHINVDRGEVKAVRIGTDGKTPPTTSVVIDCSAACKYDVLPGSDGKVVVSIPGGTSANTTSVGATEKPDSAPAKRAEPTRAALASPAMTAPSSAIPLYQQKAVAANMYNGAGGCAASSCHGSVQPRTNTRINQNEYTIWIAQDKHARAFNVLTNNVSERIGRILNIGPPSKAPKCLICHSLYVPADQQARTFELSDGVSCENCHGPASGWLGPHTTRDWPHEKSVQLGMYDTRNLERRATKCLTCHLGTAEKFVDHEMIAAGHPDLTFEIGLFTNVMPPHWKMPEQGDPWRQVKAWGVGQAVQLRDSLNRVARRASAKEGPWPEYAELDCFACHHSLTRPEESWRQERGYPGRRPGNPPWNQSRVVVFRDLVEEVAPNESKQLNDEVVQLAGLMNQLQGNREQIAASATRASGFAEELVRKIEAQGYDSALTLRLMRRIARNGNAIAMEDERPAEQAAMTLDSLFRAYDTNAKPGNSGEIRTAIGGLFALLQDPSGYSGPRFASQMQRVSEVLGR